MGIAHPHSPSWPFCQGCRFEMTLHDYSCCDFIEVINNSESLPDGNPKSIRLWERLVLSGEQLAAVSGMDLHDRRSFSNLFATYIEGTSDGVIAEELAKAIYSLQFAG